MTAAAVSEVRIIPKARLWSGRVLSTLVILFLLTDAVMKLFKPPFVVQATVQLGYPESAIVGIGTALLISSLLYAVPRTAALGAILLTAYLGGAVASNVRTGAPMFNVVFAAVFGVIVWVSLVMRDPRLEKILFHS